MNWITEYLSEIEAGRVVVSKRVRREYEKLVYHPKSNYP